jgi:hyaluronate lyase
MTRFSRRHLLTGAGGAAVGLATAAAFGTAQAGEITATADAFTDLRDRWRELSTGAARVDLTRTEFVTALSRLDTSVSSYLALIDRSAGRTRVFSDLPLAQTSDSGLVTTTYTRLRSLTVAWFTPGSRYRGDASVLADTLNGLDTANRVVYHDGASEFDNWWDFEIGASRALADCLVLLDQQLPATNRDLYAAAITHFVPDPFRTFNGGVSTGANRIDLCQAALVQGIASKSATRVQRAADGLPTVCQYGSSGDGLYSDGSFIQHTNVAYTGTYGVVLLTGLAKMLSLLVGSAWAVTDPAIRNLFDCVELGWAPLIHDGRMMSCVNGRAISRSSESEQVMGHSAIGGILRLADVVDPATAGRWRAACRGWLDRDRFRGPYEGADVPTTALVADLFADTNVTPTPEPVRSVVFRNMGRAVHRRPGWAYAISMCCDRVARYEMINGENLHGFHTGAGMTYLYDDDAGQFSDGFWPTVDPYRLPGTTVDRKPIPDGGGRTLPTTRWAGGAVLDGRYACVGMTLQADTTDLGGKKSWFCFDEYILAMGVGITSTSGYRVETFIENRHLHAGGVNALTVDGVVWPYQQNTSKTFAGVQWMHLEGVAGYTFPSLPTLRADRLERTGSFHDINTNGTTTPITRRYLTLAQDHGVNPTGGTYTYLVIPRATVGRTAELAAHRDVTILGNNTARQVVRQSATGITMANFWSAAAFTNITVDRACALVIRELGGLLTICVAEPYRSGNKIRVSFTPAQSGYRLVRADSAVTMVSTGTTIVLDVQAGTFGGTWVAEFTRL